MTRHEFKAGFSPARIEHPRGRRAPAWFCVLFMVAFIALCLGVSRALTPVSPAASAESPAPTPAAPGPLPPPPCSREKCEERPTRLWCLGWRSVGMYGNFCDNWQVVYEHHCACVEWLPRPEAAR